MASTMIAHAWITGREAVGVVITHDPNNANEPYKARIAAVRGQDADADLEYIMMNGPRLNIQAAYWIIHHHGQFYGSNKLMDFRKHLFEKEVPNG